MKETLRLVSLVFAGGALGGLANAFALWGAVKAAVLLKGHTFLSPSLPENWIYARIVWGGVWGLIFLLPGGRNMPVKRGLLLSLIPSACQLLALYPLHLPPGIFGMALNKFTPLGVVCFNLVWGVVASVWCHRAGK